MQIYYYILSEPAHVLPILYETRSAA